MKKQILLGLASVTLLTATLTACDNTTIKDRPSGQYILEEGETYTPFKVKFDEVKSIKNSSMGISGISDKLVVDPYESSFFGSNITVRYPNASQLQGKTILYTSAWYKQTTFKRSDDVTEYVLERLNGSWIVTNISSSAETFIPFNGAVLSIPKSSSSMLSLNEVVTINNDTIPVYKLGIYNQDGYRAAISTANDWSWNREGINLYDSNTLGTYTRYRFDEVATMNVLFDEKDNVYYVDKFRAHTESGRLNTNINNGFCLASSITQSKISASKEGLAVFEGVRFNHGDTIKIEDNGSIFNNSYTFNTTGINTVKLVDGNSRSFTVAKSTSNSTASRWGWEIGIDGSNTIVSTGAHVSIPSNGYKLVLSPKNNTTGEQLNHIIDQYFQLGSLVNIKSGKLTIDNSSSYRVGGLYMQTNKILEEAINDVKVKNYSYNIDALLENKEKLETIYNEVSQNLFTEDPMTKYRLYQLLGQTYQIYYNTISSTNRNEAVQVKASWYINDYVGTDKTLDSMVSNLKQIKNSGLNEIIVNVIDDGVVNYPNSSYFKQTNGVASKEYGEYGNNFLKAICEEAHKLGIKVFANFTPFTSGLEKAFTELQNAWALSIDGKTSVVSSQGKVQMLDPSNPDFVLRTKQTVSDILSNNPYLDGLHLDYIRFGADNNYINTVLGVTESALVEFNKWAKENQLSYNYSSLDALKSALKSNSAVFNAFNLFQQDLITNTVKIIKDECKKFDMPLTAAVADDYDYVKEWKCQDWGKWAKLGIIDGLYLMDYYFDEYYINYYFEDMLKNTSNATMLVTGIDPSYANLLDEYYARTIKGGVSNINSHGYSIFGTHTQNANMQSWNLIKPSNWIESLSPYDDLSKTMKASGDKLLERCDDIYIKYGNQTESQKQNLSSDLEQLYLLIGQTEDYQTCVNVINKLNEMESKSYASSHADTRINEQINYMIKIAKLKANVYKD